MKNKYITEEEFERQEKRFLGIANSLVAGIIAAIISAGVFLAISMHQYKNGDNLYGLIIFSTVMTIVSFLLFTSIGIRICAKRSVENEVKYE